MWGGREAHCMLAGSADPQDVSRTTHKTSHGAAAASVVFEAGRAPHARTRQGCSSSQPKPGQVLGTVRSQPWGGSPILGPAAPLGLKGFPSLQARPSLHPRNLYSRQLSAFESRVFYYKSNTTVVHPPVAAPVWTQSALEGPVAGHCFLVT